MDSHKAVAIFSTLFVESAVWCLNYYCKDLQRYCVNYFKNKRKSVIVRTIGSYMVQIRSTRRPTWAKNLNEDIFLSVNYSVKQHPLVTAHSNQMDYRIEELEKELKLLQDQIRSILLNQEAFKDFCYEKINHQTSQLGNKTPSFTLKTANPPPPPPLPPPFPSTPVNKTKSCTVRLKSKTNRASEKDPKTFVIEELSTKRPKLRHVELSPGGRPLRKTTKTRSPKDILTSVLKKRFETVNKINVENSKISLWRSPMEQ